MRLIRLALAFSVLATPLLADFSYKTEMKATGGTMAAALRMAQKMSKSARNAMDGTTYVKGNRMATQAGDVVTVMDLDSSTVTTIDHGKKQYSVVTFEEYSQFMARIAEKTKKKKDVQVSYTVNVKDGKKTEVIDETESASPLCPFLQKPPGTMANPGEWRW
jgi:hypothetical protein